MKTYRTLYPQITDFANLYAAFRKARRGKRDRPAVAEFEFNLEANLFQLQAELVMHTTYFPRPAPSCVAPKKKRLPAFQ